MFGFILLGCFRCNTPRNETFKECTNYNVLVSQYLYIYNNKSL